MKKLLLIVWVIIIGFTVLIYVPLASPAPLQSPISPVYTPLPWRPTPGIRPTPTNIPYYAPAETWAAQPPIIDRPMRRAR